MSLVADYGSDSEEQLPLSSSAAAPGAGAASAAPLSAAPDVVPLNGLELARQLDPRTRELMYNPSISELYAPQVGPANPFTDPRKALPKNTFTGFVEPQHMDTYAFEDQRLTFRTLGYAADPSANAAGSAKYVGDAAKALANKGDTLLTASMKDKRKRESRGDAADISSFKGPWAGFEGESRLSKPTPDQQEAIDEALKAPDELAAAKNKKQEFDEKSTLHIKDFYDYMGRTYMHPPQQEGIHYGQVPEKCFLPKNLIHTWTGHTKGVSCVRFFPVSAHMILSAGQDSKIKLWEVYGERRVLRTFLGHTQAVRDVCFNNKGTQFVSCGYDRYCRLWDTETGQCISRFTNKRVPYCVKFHPDEDKQHLFVTGTADKKILCWDTRSNEIVQDYDRHLGAVNTITFVEEGRRIVSTSDDKSIRVWEWDIPVDMKYIADPSMHAIPAVALHPNAKWMICQSMDNSILTFSAYDKFRANKKKTFKGHTVAGYACEVAFSPCGSYVLSGDANGFMYIWDWKTTKFLKRIKAHDGVCIGVAWNPNETSKVVTCGWDGTIKYWD
eukprot:m.62417 g.62417  ORF g.62417 m.62417 type:complete len:556 (-) comp13800_c0_seq1:190-1857(-)